MDPQHQHQHQHPVQQPQYQQPMQMVPQQQALAGYTVVQTPQGSYMVPSVRPPIQTSPIAGGVGQAASPFAGVGKLLILAVLVAGGIWLYGKYKDSKSGSSGGRRSMHDRRSRRSRSRLLSEVNRFLDDHEGVGHAEEDGVELEGAAEE